MIAMTSSRAFTDKSLICLIPCTCKYFFLAQEFHSDEIRFRLISLNAIVLKIPVANNSEKLQLHPYFAAKDFTPHKPCVRAMFFAGIRKSTISSPYIYIKGNSKESRCSTSLFNK